MMDNLKLPTIDLHKELFVDNINTLLRIGQLEDRVSKYNSRVDNISQYLKETDNDKNNIKDVYFKYFINESLNFLFAIHSLTRELYKDNYMVRNTILSYLGCIEETNCNIFNKLVAITPHIEIEYSGFKYHLRQIKQTNIENLIYCVGIPVEKIVHDICVEDVVNIFVKRLITLNQKRKFELSKLYLPRK